MPDALKREQRHTAREARENGGRGWSHAATNQGLPGGHQQLEQQEGLFPRVCKGNMALLTPSLLLSSFWNWEMKLMLF